jgi:polyphenol oxidase
MIALKPENGILLEDDLFRIFFGNSTFSKLIEPNPPENFCLLKQVHGCQLVEASHQKLVEADAHWTKNPKMTLLIKTADCLPIIATSAEVGWILAIHAGWRGVEQKIVTQSLQTVLKNPDTSLQIYIGPHIQSWSFEVGQDVAKSLLSSHGLTIENAELLGLCSAKEKKYLIDLSALVVRELESLGIEKKQIWMSTIDTKTNPDYFSYRRGDVGVRNFSLVQFKI